MVGSFFSPLMLTAMGFDSVLMTKEPTLITMLDISTDESVVQCEWLTLYLQKPSWTERVFA